MSAEQTVHTVRDVQVLRIPSGEQIHLPVGTPVVITQALGGSFTLLVPSQAGLFRLSGEDSDAIGHAAAAAPTCWMRSGRRASAAAGDVG